MAAKDIVDLASSFLYGPSGSPAHDPDKADGMAVFTAISDLLVDAENSAKYATRASALSGGPSAYTGTISNPPTAYLVRMSFWVNFPSVPSAGATVNLSSLGTKTLARSDGVTIAAGEVAAGPNLLVYDGTKMRVAGVPRVGTIGTYKDMKTFAVRSANVGSTTVGATGTASYFGSSGAGRWRLVSVQNLKGLLATSTIYLIKIGRIS